MTLDNPSEDMPTLVPTSTKTVVPRHTRVCVRSPAGLPACSRSKPTIAPKIVAANSRRMTRSNSCGLDRPLVNSCHKTSMTCNHLNLRLRELVNSLSADVTISHHFDFIQACATLPKTEDTTRFSGVEFSTLTYQ